jgi:hypothetical protein
LRLWSLPRYRALANQEATGLRRCSPQSSVPRQTVGHHAKAAIYEMGLRAAGEGCRGEVPSTRPDIPPTGGFPCSFLIYPPASVQCCARADGLLSKKPNPAKLIWVRFAKNRLAAKNRNFVSHKADVEMQGGAPAR